MKNQFLNKTKAWIIKKRKLLYAVVPYSLLLLTYLFLPFVTGKNFYQIYGYNQTISINIDAGESSLYTSRLLTYKENSPDAAKPGDRALFISEISGETLTVDGTITSVFPDQHYFVVESSHGVSNNIYDADYVGSYVRVSTFFDRIAYLNFKLPGRLLIGANITLLTYFIYYLNTRKKTVRQ
ncbi:MAG: hypothetical protein NTV44_05325 [Firmicutes bacterium]|nr:hypothetical protein [Bacillota bacterium]